MSQESSSDSESTESLVTVSRTMRVLEMLSGEPDGMSLADIARALGVAKSIALRILSTLQNENYLFRAQDGQRYALSYKISNVGLKSLSGKRVLEQIQPKLREIAEASGELVLFSVANADGPQWILSAMGSARRRLQIEPSMRMDLHSTATGKAWLSTLEDDQIDSILSKTLVTTTAHTKTSKSMLLDEIRKIRLKGVSYSDQENEEGIKAVAVPIWQTELDSTRQCVGFVSITAPVSRTTDEHFERFEKLLKDAALYFSDVWLLRAANDMTYARAAPQL